ncbi:MAG: sugar ABC transporter ATP-binding protein, partial [Microbacterium sp.]
GARKHYGGVQALKGVDIDIRAGEVHCLAGANGSGKSTLIKAVNGVERLDAGTVEVDGERIGRITVHTAIASGIHVIYQDLSLFTNLTVAENIAMTGRVASGRSVVIAQEARVIAVEVLQRLNLDIDPDALVQNIPVAQRQLVAVCRALANDVKVLFMDEPTTSLTWSEVEVLFMVVAALRDSGVAVVFVSHKTEEVFALSDVITVLRNGEVSASGRASDFTRDSLAEALIGRSAAEERIVAELPVAAEPVLSVAGLGVPGLFEDVSFTVHAGEILGLTGLLGDGRGEIVDGIFGVIRADAGSVHVDGRRVTPGSVRSAIEAGIGYVPADRLTQGLFLRQPIDRNMVAASLPRFSTKTGLLKMRSISSTVRSMIDDLRMKVGHQTDAASTLSGGNQQRIVIGKWLATDPRVLILNGPTVGVDIGSKEIILQLLREAASRGLAVVIVSDDIPELVAACHRVLVVRRGRITDEITSDAVAIDVIRERSIA